MSDTSFVIEVKDEHFDWEPVYRFCSRLDAEWKLGILRMNAKEFNNGRKYRIVEVKNGDVE